MRKIEATRFVYLISILIIYSPLFGQERSNESGFYNGFEYQFKGWNSFEVVPLYVWANPTVDLANLMISDATYASFSKWNFTPNIIRNEISFFRKGRGTKEVFLTQNGTYSTLYHEPNSGYSEWTLPDFNVLKNEVSNKLSPYWHVIKFDFFLDQEKSLAEFTQPLQFRTSLSPRNKIEISLYNDGTLGFATQNSAVKNFERSKRSVNKIGRNKLEYRISSDGAWYLLANEELIMEGEMDPVFFQAGLSNKYWFEGSINFFVLSIEEMYPKEYLGKVYGLTHKEFDVIDNYISKSFHKYLRHYLLFSSSELKRRILGIEESQSTFKDEIYDTSGWKYRLHERTYIRRLSMKQMEGSIYSGYSVGLIINGINSEGQSISIPVQYTFHIRESDKFITSFKLIFNEDFESYFLDRDELNDLVAFLKK